MKKFLLVILMYLCFVQTVFSINGLWLERHDGTRVGYILDNIYNVEYLFKGIKVYTYQSVDEYAFNEVKKIYFANDIFLRGDADGNGVVDMMDVYCIISYILNNHNATFNKEAADANQDGVVSMPDVMFIINYIHNGRYPR